MADRVKLIRAIKTAQRELCLDDGTYRATLLGICGKDSCSKMSEKELGKALAHLRRLGFRPKDDPTTRAQRGLIVGIWQAFAECGEVQNGSMQALNAYVGRRFNLKLDDLGTSECQAVIEQLKRWARRTSNPQLEDRLLALLS